MPFFEFAWLIPVLPLAAFLLISLVPAIGRSRSASYTTAIALLAGSTILAWGVLFQGATAGFPQGQDNSLTAHEARAGLQVASAHFPSIEAPALAAEGGPIEFPGFGKYYRQAFAWAPDGGEGATASYFELGYRLDAPVALMLAMVTLAALCIHIFSVGYMAHDEYPAGHQRQSRFFSYIALFTASMLGMTLADNLLLFFICWELMGLCSFLLIGFWYFKPSAREAAKKAFITTRIGDVGMMIGMVYLYNVTGSLTFGTEPGQIFHEASLQAMAASTVPVIGVSVATTIALLLFMGTVGKSAQFPLHVWLPDAMEGPTPVSALIHAATMVAAGVFLVIRTYPIFVADQVLTTGFHALSVVAFVGAFTALFAALIAVAQYDIKRILAFSTLSQLGFMVAALGIGAWVAALFHLLTHAFFKALLFLGSGSVIHGMEETVGHDPEKAQDIRNMGNIRKFMPVTWVTYLLGYLALAGIPPFAGFWSKDEILADAFNHGHVVVGSVLIAAAFLTAFYMTRQIVVVFFGTFKGYDPRRTDTEHSEPVAVTGPEHHGHDDHGDHHHAHTPHDPHESPRSMTGPLIVLALFAVFAGFANTPLFHGLSDFLQQRPGVFNVPIAGLATGLAVLGIVLGFLTYRNAFQRSTDVDPLAKALGPIWTAMENKFGFDWLYQKSFIAGTYGLGRVLSWIDRNIVDRIVNWTGLGTLFVGRMNFIVDDFTLNTGTDALGEGTVVVGDGLRQSITGKIQDYGAYIFGGVVVVALIYLYAF